MSRNKIVILNISGCLALMISSIFCAQDYRSLAVVGLGLVQDTTYKVGSTVAGVAGFGLGLSDIAAKIVDPSTGYWQKKVTEPEYRHAMTIVEALMLIGAPVAYGARTFVHRVLNEKAQFKESERAGRRIALVGYQEQLDQVLPNVYMVPLRSSSRSGLGQFHRNSMPLCMASSLTRFPCTRSIIQKIQEIQEQCAGASDTTYPDRIIQGLEYGLSAYCLYHTYNNWQNHPGICAVTGLTVGVMYGLQAVESMQKGTATIVQDAKREIREEVGQLIQNGVQQVERVVYPQGTFTSALSRFVPYVAVHGLLNAFTGTWIANHLATPVVSAGLDGFKAWWRTSA